MFLSLGTTDIQSRGLFVVGSVLCVTGCSTAPWPLPTKCQEHPLPHHTPVLTSNSISRLCQICPWWGTGGANSALVENRSSIPDARKPCPLLNPRTLPVSDLASTLAPNTPHSAQLYFPSCTPGSTPAGLWSPAIPWLIRPF